MSWKVILPHSGNPVLYDPNGAYYRLLPSIFVEVPGSYYRASRPMENIYFAIMPRLSMSIIQEDAPPTDIQCKKAVYVLEGGPNFEDVCCYRLKGVES